MKTVWYITIGCVVSWLLVSIGFLRESTVEILLGMIAPLAITIATLILVERANKRDPREVTPMMIKAFIAKIVLVGAYVAIVLGILSVQAKPFIASFTTYFLGLYFVEFLCLRRIGCITT